MTPNKKDIITSALRKRIRSETEGGKARNADRQKSDAGKRVEGEEERSVTLQSGIWQERQRCGGGGGGSSRSDITTPSIRSRQTVHKEHISAACEGTGSSTSPGVVDAALIEAFRKRFPRQTNVFRNLSTRCAKKRRTARACQSGLPLCTCRCPTKFTPPPYS